MTKEQLLRYRRYFVTYMRHMTLRKALNMAKVEWKLWRGDSSLDKVLPYLLMIDVSNNCNLKCPLCEMGQGHIKKRKNRITLETYKEIVEQFEGRLLQVFFYNWGEPFLNKDIYDILSYTAECNIGSTVSSNCTLPIDAERLVKSGLEHLVVSGDGITQDVYELYRRGGNLETVLKNVEVLVKARKKLGKKNPFIEWQCLVHKGNEHQLEEIENSAYALGVDQVRFCSMNLYSSEDPDRAVEEWMPRNPAYQTVFEPVEKNNGRERRPCYFLWRVAVVCPDGGLVPCCLYDVKEWGNLFDSVMQSIWTNGLYQKARSMKGCVDMSDYKGLVCSTCQAPHIYKQTKGHCDSGGRD